jgi:hypothetical protein
MRTLNQNVQDMPKLDTQAASARKPIEGITTTVIGQIHLTE